MRQPDSNMITTDIDRAIAVLKQDGLVAIPTETVYGLAANAYSEVAVRKIFALKQRPLSNPLIVHIPSTEVLDEIALHIPDVAWKLAEKCWPGPLTLLLEKRAHIPEVVTAGKDTVAVRVPAHPLTRALLENLPFPLVAPSANPFGSISPTRAEHVSKYFGKELEVILDGGECRKGLESTIVGFEHGQPVLYRRGSIPAEEIEKITGPLKVVTNNDEAPLAPGMQSRHYAPDTPTILTDDVAGKLGALEGKKIGLLLFQNPVEHKDVVHCEILSASGNLEEAASNLYAALHRLDGAALDVIVAERVPDTGLGKTINDKLERASAVKPTMP